MQQSRLVNSSRSYTSMDKTVHATLICSGVDYIRVTAKPGASRLRLADIYGDLSNKLCSEGHTEKPSRVKGYKGYSTANITYGYREDGALLQCSGALAGYVYSLLPEDGVQCPRIDLQTTYDFGIDRENWYIETADAIRSWQAANPAPKHPKVGIDGYYGAGFTCYLGKRTSAAMGRTYDKGREKSSEYVLGTWRHEVEYHNELATKVLGVPALRTRPAETSASLVIDWFRNRGAPIPYSVAVETEGPSIKHVKTDDEKRLKWLREDVSPTVLRLIKAGLEKECIEAIMSAYTTYKAKLDTAC